MLKQGSGLTAVFDPTHPAVSLTALNDLFNWPSLNLMMHCINLQCTPCCGIASENALNNNCEVGGAIKV